MNGFAQHRSLSPTLAWSLPRLSVPAIGGWITALDLAFALAYWQSQGVGASRVLESMASWLIDVRNVAWPIEVGVALAFLGTIYVSASFGLDALFGRSIWARAHGWFCGALYGIALFAIVFLVLVPALIAPRQIAADTSWVATCLVLHAALIGPLMAALLLRRRTP